MSSFVAQPYEPIVLRMPVDEGNEILIGVPKRMIDRSIVVGSHDPLTGTPPYEEAANKLLEGDRWSSRRIFVTSARDGDGKTRTAFNLAASLASGGKRVLLVEINFTQPRFRALLGNLRIRYGIDTATSGAATPAESVFSVEGSGLHLTAVRCATSAARLERCLLHLNDFLDWANEQYELLVIDCPSVLSPEWSRWFHAFVGQALLVVREDRTPRADIRTAARLLGDHLTGAWFNHSQQIPAELTHSRPARVIGSEVKPSPRSLESIRTITTLLAHTSGTLDVDRQNQF